MFLSPQATTWPSRFKATLNPLWDRPPAAMATTLVRSPGTVASPDRFRPQPTTVPAEVRARLCSPPAATAVKRVLGFTRGSTIEPQLTIWPWGLVEFRCEVLGGGIAEAGVGASFLGLYSICLAGS